MSGKNEDYEKENWKCENHWNSSDIGYWNISFLGLSPVKLVERKSGEEF